MALKYSSAIVDTSIYSEYFAKVKEKSNPTKAQTPKHKVTIKLTQDGVLKLVSATDGSTLPSGNIGYFHTTDEGKLIFCRYGGVNKELVSVVPNQHGDSVIKVT